MSTNAGNSNPIDPAVPDDLTPEDLAKQAKVREWQKAKSANGKTAPDGSGDHNGSPVPVEAKVLSYDLADHEVANAHAVAEPVPIPAPFADESPDDYEARIEQDRLYQEQLEEIFEERLALEREAWEVSQWFGDADAPPPVDNLRDIRAKHHLFTEDELAERIRAAGNQRYLIADLLPMRSTGLMVGESNIGKSPLLYQLGLCVAAGVPFFGHATIPGPVIYADYENNIAESHDCAKTIAEFLGLPSVPKEFLFWNAHDSAVGFNGMPALMNMIREIRPALTIIDTLSKAFPEAEGENPDANKILNKLLGVIADSGGSIMLSHHFKKNRKKGSRGKTGRGSDLTPQEMANDARGASALVSGVDLRLVVVPPPQVKMFDIPVGWKGPMPGAPETECAFEILGFRRMGGDIPAIAVERVFQEQVAVGYRQIVSVARLRNPHYQQVFEALPDPFRPKDVEAHFPNSGGSVQKFFKACHLAGIITKVELPVTPGFRHRVGYAKRKATPPPPDPAVPGDGA